MTEKISNFSLNETLTNVELLHDKQHQNFLIIDSSSEDDIENPTSNLTLGQTFQTWDEAEKFLNDYALEKGFSIRRKRTENDDNKILRKISWECCCAGNYQPKKILNPNDQRNCQSKATGCKWRVNGNLPKNSLRISFTTVVDEHNHQMIPSPSTNIAKYRKLGEDMIQFIDFCVQNGTTGAQTIVRLLRGKFPGRKIHQKNLYNAIQASKKKLASRIEFDASDLMKFLYSQQTDDSLIDNCNRTRLVATALLEDETEESFIWALSMIKKGTNDLIPKVVFTDSDPAMANAISLEFPDTIHCLCIFHIDLNLKKNLRNKLKSDEFKAFREEFFHCRNTLISTLFENRWEHLKLKYPSAGNYIRKQLDPLKYKWAVCYTNNQFTAGANSTQRVESLNHKIHDCVRSLLTLVKEIQYILDKESEYARVEEYKDQIPIVGLATIPKAYFKSIEKVVSEFLMPAMVFLVCKQMQECFYYDSFKMDVAIIDSIIQEQTNTDYNEGMREDNYEVVKVHFTDIISKIVDGSHRCLIEKRPVPKEIRIR
ncbi:unnamed protein product [Rhizophagus irregularis]|nr:unnamed protein product [Rhizophagus irregularis]